MSHTRTVIIVIGDIMFYSIYNFIYNLSFWLLLGFYFSILTLIFILSSISNVKRIKNIEKIKGIKTKSQWFVLLMFCSVSLLIKQCKLEIVLGGVCLLLCYILAINFFQKNIEKRCLEKQNDREKVTDFFERNDSVIERSKKILSTIKTTTKTPTNYQKEAPNDKLNFSHVKSVIKKLQNYSLNQTEKKQVEELSITMYALENGSTSENEKTKLNDGLNSLLKIMAKYSV